MKTDGRLGIVDGSFALTIPTWLCISLWHQRTGGLGGGGNLTRDLAGSLLLLWGFAAAMTLLPWPSRGPSAERGAVATVLACATMLFASWTAWSGSGGDDTRPTLVAWALIAATASATLFFAVRRSATVRTMLNVVGGLLLAFSLPKLLPEWTRDNAAAAAADRRDGRRPDVYIFVLDKYTSGAALAAAWGYDHRPFEDSLRALGFTVPTLVRANYAHTKLAIPAFLEGEYPAVPADGIGDNDRFEAMSERIADSPLWRRARDAGYRVFGFTTLFSGTREFADSVQEIHAPQHADAQWAETLILNSPAPVLRPYWCRIVTCEAAVTTPYPVRGIETLDWRLRQVTALADSAGPVFAFVHLLSPHEPYLFAKGCGRREPWWPFTDQIPNEQAALREAYVTQVQCLDQRMLGMIRSLLARPGVPPVILLQGDHVHGRLSLGWFGGVSIAREAIGPRALADRMTVFGAYRFPGSDSLVPDETTPVNVMRAMRRSLFGDSLPPLPDHSFWSSYQTALWLEEIDPARIHTALNLTFPSR